MMRRSQPSMRLTDLALGRRGDESAIDLRRALAALADLASSCSTLANANRSEEIHVDARSSIQSWLGRYEQWTASSWLQIPVQSGARLHRQPTASWLQSCDRLTAVAGAHTASLRSCSNDCTLNVWIDDLPIRPPIQQLVGDRLALPVAVASAAPSPPRGRSERAEAALLDTSRCWCVFCFAAGQNAAVDADTFPTGSPTRMSSSVRARRHSLVDYGFRVRQILHKGRKCSNGKRSSQAVVARGPIRQTT